MNQHDPHSPADSDIETFQLLALLKQVNPPLEARVNFRMTIARELARLQEVSRRPEETWWKRSINVPLPLAFGLALSILLTVVVWLRQPPSRNVPRNDSAFAPPRHSRASDVPPKDLSTLAASPEDALELYVSNTYLCGVGPLSTESRYVLQEPGK